jgi:hypothetical protein
MEIRPEGGLSFSIHTDRHDEVNSRSFLKKFANVSKMIGNYVEVKCRDLK